jgi:hypothetical protein
MDSFDWLLGIVDQRQSIKQQSICQKEGPFLLQATATDAAVSQKQCPSSFMLE